MAFVYQSRRNFNFSTNENLTIGPGAYISQTDYKKEKSQIPFSSSSVRNKTSFNSLPGPGSYDTNTKQPIKIDQFGRQKCSPSFASNLDRFFQNNSNLIPGPGSYNTTKG